MTLRRAQIIISLILLFFVLFAFYFGVKSLGAENFISGIYELQQRMGFGVTAIRWCIEATIVLGVPRYLAKRKNPDPETLKAIQALLMRFILAYELLFGLNIFNWIVNL